ncbi:MAG: T9SS type A sorting domain-containing protein [Sphingobacteriia bacterium]|nr:T9SS type A sorting domain-containing protein [Sphingobacteriia bacterium]
MKKTNHLRLLFLLSLFSLFITTGVNSQNFVEIGSGVVSTTLPPYTIWNYSWSGQIYNHTALGAAKSITKIGLNCVSGNRTVTNQKIYMKLSTDAVFSNANYENPTANGYTLVYDGPITFNLGWTEIQLIAPFAYDGTKNIIIFWENRSGVQSYTGPNFTSTSSTINDTKDFGQDATFPGVGTSGYLNPYPSALPNMRFYYTSTGPATPSTPIPADNAKRVFVSTHLSFTLGANTTSYDLYFGLSEATMTKVVDNAPCTAGVYSYTPAALLTGATSYFWKVVAKNGATSEVGPVWDFLTEPVVYSFPYTQTFEDSTIFNSYPNDPLWIINPEFSWYRSNEIVHSGLSSAKSFSLSTTSTNIMQSQRFILPASQKLSFFWKNADAKVPNHDTTYVQVSTNEGQSWITLGILCAPVASGWEEKSYDISPYAGNNFYFRFKYRTDKTTSAESIFIDDLSITQISGTSSLSVTPSTQNVTSPLGTTSFTVTSNIAWTAVSDQTWCTVTPSGTNNGTIQANYLENTSTTPRTANITVSGVGVAPVTVSVVQAGVSLALAVTPANQNVPYTTGSTNFTVTSNVNWTAISNSTWCTVTPSGTGNGTLTANYTENTDPAQRIANITVSAPGIADVIVTVTQNAFASTLTVSPSNQNVTSAAGVTSFTVTSNSAWTISSDASWCTVPASGTGNNNFNATYEENTTINQRIANITVSVPGIANVVVTVTQAGKTPVLNVTPALQQVSASAGSTSYTVTCNGDWSVQANASWVTVPANGSGNGTLNVQYDANSGAERMADITITTAGLAPVVVQLKQDQFIGIDNLNLDQFNVYPNPSTGLFTLKNNSSSLINVSLEVVNQSGNVVLSTGEIALGEYVIDLTNLPKSMYFLRIKGHNGVASYKLVTK